MEDEEMKESRTLAHELMNMMTDKENSSSVNIVSITQGSTSSRIKNESLKPPAASKTVLK